MRALLRRLPITYHGTLQGAELVQFSLDPDEVRPLVPAPLSPCLLHGRSLVSCLRVEMRRLRPRFVPRFLSVCDRHVALRLMVHDRSDPGPPHGAYLLRAFTDRRWIARACEWLSWVQLLPAELNLTGGDLEVREGGHRLHFTTFEPAPSRPPGVLFSSWEEARAVVGSIDRLHAGDGQGRLWVTDVSHADCPLQPLGVRDFHTDFFESARVEGAFRIPRTVYHRWTAPRRSALMQAEEPAPAPALPG